MDEFYVELGADICRLASSLALRCLQIALSQQSQHSVRRMSCAIHLLRLSTRLRLRLDDEIWFE